MSNIKKWLNESSYIEPMSPACEMCAMGSKMVILITGLCPAGCFYCPLSIRKLGKDRIFADEWELDNEDDAEKLIKEAECIEADGAGITGGDPLTVYDRTTKYISFLKNRFGKKFHIHLYTSGLQNGEKIGEIVNAGLDEIRFHPMPSYWKSMDKNPILKSIKNALSTDADVGIEIPVIPGMENDIQSMVKWADDNGVKWVNLNELEFSETNADELKKRGFTVKDEISAAVTKSQKSAEKLVKWRSESNMNIGIHYCSSSFKDGIQLRNRIKRRARNIASPHDVITKDGTLVKGVIIPGEKTLIEAMQLLKEFYKINEKYLLLNLKKNRVEIAVWLLEKIAADLEEKGFECFMVEEYPTADALEVERTPLPL